MITLNDIRRLCNMQDDCLHCPISDKATVTCVLTYGCKPGDWDPEDIEERMRPKLMPYVFYVLREVQEYCKSIGTECKERCCPLWKSSTGCIIQDSPECWHLEKLEESNEARRD